MRFSSLVCYIWSKSFVITSHYCKFGQEKEDCLIFFPLPSDNHSIHKFTNQLEFRKKLEFPELLSKNVSLKHLNDHQLAHKEILKGIRFFIQNGQEVQKLIGHICSVDDAKDDIYPIGFTYLSKTKALHLKNDGIDVICTIFGAKWPKVLLMCLILAEKSKTLTRDENGELHWKFVEEDVHENYWSEIDSNSEHGDHEVSDEDYFWIERLKILKIHVTRLHCLFFLYMNQKTLKLTTNTLDCDNILVKQEIDSVLNAIRIWILTSKLPTKDVERRQCNGLLGYANSSKNCLLARKPI